MMTNFYGQRTARLALALLMTGLLFASLMTAKPTTARASLSQASSQQPAPSTTTRTTTPTAAAAAAIPLPAGVERVTSVEGITEYRLANGLRVLLFPDPSKPTVTVNITYLVGSRHENYGETGMAHLLEHLLFMGSKNHPAILKEFADHGTRRNGTTWLDRTNYYETFVATEENLRWALEMEADRMINSFIARKDLDSQMSVVRNEFEAGENDPQGVMLERAVSTAFLWHNYGNSTIGARSDIENVPIERLQAFYRNYYQPDNAVLLVAGRFDEATTLELVNKNFSTIPRPRRELQSFYTVEPVQDGERAVTLRRVGDVQAVQAVYHVPSGSHPDYAAIDVLTEILGDTPSGRLHKALVETKKASSVGGFSFQLREPGVAIFSAEVRADASLDAARDALLQTVESLSANPPTKEETERARRALLKEIEQTFNSSERVGLAMSEWLGMGDWRLFFLHRDRLREVSPEDVARVAARYLKPSNRTLAMFIPTAKPDRAEIPATPDLAAMLKDYKGDAAISVGEAFDPSPSNIETRVRRSVTPGGIKLALLPKKTRGATVVAALTLRFGDEKSRMNRTVPAQLAAQMLMRGTSRHTRQQLKDELDRLRASVSVTGGPSFAFVTIETVRDNLQAVLRLVAEGLREPSFPAEEFEQLRQEQLAVIEQQRSDPQAIATVTLNRHLNPYPKGDPRYVMTTDEQLEAIRAVTLEEVKKVYAEFYGASHGELAVVGDFDEQETARTALELLGNWKSPVAFERLVNLYKDVASINKSFDTPDKANAFFTTGLNIQVRDDDPDYPALVLGNYILGNSDNSRLRMRIRVKEGLSYGVGSRILVSSLDKAGTFTSFAIYAPQNVARVEAAYKEEVARALSEGFTAAEVEAAKAGYLQSQQVNRAQDSVLARTLSARLYVDRTLAWDADFEKKIAALTPEEITAAMRRHIDPARITIIKAGDFLKAPAN
ncbi:MAG TPA: pitrilysin family protein [Pyrinomonadaceae bacterium]|jgi:zinc protease|nr:pitrilysin family protein [Pyrinomonadaceae bacterium]